VCGIVGFIEPEGFASGGQAQKILGLMVRSLSHRGPDDEGLWFDAQSGIALGHRRLAVIDLSPQGRQPMESPDGRYVISFNGEIYNFRLLAEELERTGLAPFWRGHSDTEVFLAAIVAWGLKEALRKSVGMFAFALYDKQERILYLVRDRMGEKPLYYGWAKSTFLFASELKALRAHPKFMGEIDPEALGPLLRHNYIPSPWSIYKNVRKVPPGSFLAVPLGLDSPPPGSWPRPQNYWDPLHAAITGLENPFEGPEKEATDHLEELLKKAVEGQMISDVPLGAFLSGGIDSSTVVAVMQL
jgi:Asparagine synthase (glutamine-hydrolyzing)